MANELLKDTPTEILQDMIEGEAGIINLIQSEITRINAYTNKSSYAVELLVIRNEYVTAYETVKKELIDRGIKVNDAFKIAGRPENQPKSNPKITKPKKEKPKEEPKPSTDIPKEEPAQPEPVTEPAAEPEKIDEPVTDGKSNKE